ncbi:MAG: 1-acyl-sn-glycerol-3-phosphate acyltransferase [Muribaculaceae bacterium]|nr:1-acyl-sn-glycerol-3-phosphate acyltransferase [Muribaculaceae bacterium]
MIFLYRIYQWLIAAPLFIIATFFTALVTSIGSVAFSGDFWGYWPPHYWSKFTCWIFLIRVKVIGRENVDKKTSYIFVANHQGAFDIFAIYGFLNHNFKWLMKKSLEKIFMVGGACRRANHIFVDDTRLGAIKETIAKAEDTLKDGMSLVIFPEGSRSWDGKMIPFKRGAFMLASEFNLPVVPLTIEGCFERMPRYTYNITPGLITIQIHKPIYPGPNGFNTKALLSECYDTVQSGLKEKHKGVSSGQRVK